MLPEWATDENTREWLATNVKIDLASDGKPLPRKYVRLRQGRGRGCKGENVFTEGMTVESLAEALDNELQKCDRDNGAVTLEVLRFQSTKVIGKSIVIPASFLVESDDTRKPMVTESFTADLGRMAVELLNGSRNTARDAMDFALEQAKRFDTERAMLVTKIEDKDKIILALSSAHLVQTTYHDVLTKVGYLHTGFQDQKDAMTERIFEKGWPLFERIVDGYTGVMATQGGKINIPLKDAIATVNHVIKNSPEDLIPFGLQLRELGETLPAAFMAAVKAKTERDAKEAADKKAAEDKAAAEKAAAENPQPAPEAKP